MNELVWRQRSLPWAPGHRCHIRTGKLGEHHEDAGLSQVLHRRKVGRPGHPEGLSTSSIRRPRHPSARFRSAAPPTSTRPSRPPGGPSRPSRRRRAKSASPSSSASSPPTRHTTTRWPRSSRLEDGRAELAVEGGAGRRTDGPPERDHEGAQDLPVRGEPGHDAAAAASRSACAVSSRRGTGLSTRSPARSCRRSRPGCTMVLKPSEIAPLSGYLWAQIMDEAGVPRRCLQHGERRRPHRRPGHRLAPRRRHGVLHRLDSGRRRRRDRRGAERSSASPRSSAASRRTSFSTTPISRPP